jgi:Tol biopolymer transport system component/DNA-binding winged helix-turn-helix (wHTH) protein
VDSLATKGFRIAGWAVAPRLNSISQDGKTIRLEPKVMQVLVCLASAPGDVVSKDDLIRKVWSGTFVTDDVVKRCVAELRKAFDDDPKNPSVIETIPRVGYRLIAPLDVADTNGATGLTAARPFRRPRNVFLLLALILVMVALIAITWLMRSRKPASMQVRSLTTLAGFEGSPSFSPDGAQVAFDHADDSGAEWNIYVQAVGDEKSVRLTSPPGSSRCPAWSPDGRTIAYTRQFTEQPSTATATIALMSPLGGSQQDLLPVTPQNNCRVSWSPDGGSLAFANEPAGGAAGVFVLSLADRRVERLSTAPTGTEDKDPAFSPDGSSLAFVRHFSWDTRDIYIVRRDGTELRRLTSLNANLGGPVREADGKHILFWSSAQGSGWGSDLYRISAAGGSPERLPLGSNDASHATVSAKANRLAYVKTLFDVNIWKISSGGKKPPERLASSSRVDISPALSPDGKHLAFVSDRDGSLAIWMADRDGSNPLKVSALQQGGSLAWSPDGTQIAYDSRPDGRGHIYVVNPFTREQRQLTQGSQEDAAPSWSADGSWVYFDSLRSGQWNIWKIATSGGEPVRVTENRGVHPAEAPNGKYLYYAKPANPATVSSTAEVPGIWRMPTAGGAEELVLSPPIAPDGWYWTVGQKGIYFVSSGRKSGASLKLFNLTSREVGRVAELEKYPWGGPGLVISPDGASVLYSQVDVAGSDIVIVDGYR